MYPKLDTVLASAAEISVIAANRKLSTLFFDFAARDYGASRESIGASL